jgi:anti-sigma-K factor RskA
MTTPHAPRYDDYLPSYALGALEGEELRELERHLEGGCTKCEEELDRLRRDLELLAETVDPLVPSELTRARVLKAAAEGRVKDRGGKSATWWIAAAAVAVLAIAWAVTRELQWRALVGADDESAQLRADLVTTQRGLASSKELVAQTQSDLDRTAKELARSIKEVDGARVQLQLARTQLDRETENARNIQRRLESAQKASDLRVEELRAVQARLQDSQAEITRLSQQLVSLRSERDRSLALLASRERVKEILVTASGSWIELSGEEPLPAASALLFVNRETGQAVFFGEGLPLLAADQDYQLWSISDGPPQTAGVFQATAEGEATHIVDRVRSLEKVTTWAVTIEPAGGVPQPTGEIILAGAAG